MTTINDEHLVQRPKVRAQRRSNPAPGRRWRALPLVLELAEFEPPTVRADELVNGVTSWPAKVDDAARRRQESYEQGHGYDEVEPED